MFCYEPVHSRPSIIYYNQCLGFNNAKNSGQQDIPFLNEFNWKAVLKYVATAIDEKENCTMGNSNFVKRMR